MRQRGRLTKRDFNITTDKSTTTLPLPVFTVFYFLKGTKKSRNNNPWYSSTSWRQSRHLSQVSHEVTTGKQGKAHPLCEIICIYAKTRERLMFMTVQSGQVCSELSAAEEEPSLKRVGGFLMRCQERLQLNRLGLCRATQRVKRMVRVQLWTVNTGNTLWIHGTLTCRVIRLTLHCRFCNFQWTFPDTPDESGRPVFLEASAVGMSDAQRGGVLSIWSDSDISRSKHLGSLEIPPVLHTFPFH